MIERIQLLEITKKKKYCHQIKLIPNTAFKLMVGVKTRVCLLV